MTIFAVSLTVPIWLTRPASFLPRSISIRCSANSFGSESNSCSKALSSSTVLPRGRVPAIGRTVISSSSIRTNISGEEPTI